MTTARTPVGEGTRERILGAAASVLARRGFAQSTLGEIAEIAQVKTPALYYYYSSRDELLAEVLHTGQQRVRAHVETALAALPSEASHQRRIETACEAHLGIQFAMADFARAVTRNMAHATGPVHRQLQRESEAYHDVWRGLLTEASRAGALRPELDPSAARMLVIGALNWTTDWMSGDPTALIAQAKALVLHGIFARA